MQTENSAFVNNRLFIIAIITLVAGYGLMAVSQSEFIRLTLSPITIISGFVLVVLSILIPLK